MAKPKWTQGEWHAFMGYLTSPEGKDYPVADVLCHGRTIASVEWPLDDPEELAANCRLLAAAPDLYEALELAVEKLREYADMDRWSQGEGGGCMSDPDEFIREAVEKAEAALRKARGEE